MSRDAETMPGVKAVYHARGDDLGMPSFQGFPMMPPTAESPDLREGRREVRRRHRRCSCRDLEGRRQSMRPTPLSSTTSGSTRSSPPAQASRRRRSRAVPRARIQRLLRHRPRSRRRPVRGRRRDRRGHDDQPATRRRADGEQRHPRRARRFVGTVDMLDLTPGTPLRPWRHRGDARHGAGRPPRGLPVGRRRLRSEGCRVPRVPRRRGRVPSARRAREVGRDAIRKTWSRSSTAGTT